MKNIIYDEEKKNLFKKNDLRIIWVLVDIYDVGASWC